MQSRVRSSRDAMQESMQQIVTLNNELEQRVQNRTEELSQERDKANQLASIKTRFLANMSHEIRTPLTVIKGFTEQLLLKLQGEDAVLISRIQQNTTHLKLLVDDILDTAKIDEGKMRLELQHLNLEALLGNVAESIETLASQKGLKLTIDTSAARGLTLWADPFRLKQILLNLLSNAIKFTKKGEICLNLQRQTNGDMQISLIDQGIGISAVQLPLLFQAFSQADNSTSRHFGGTGLGLYISQQLAEAMQIKISVESIEGEGSTFHLQIPAALLSQADECKTLIKPVDQGSATIPPARVLIVDDVADIRALLASYLEDQPLTLSFAADGQAAVTLCQQQTFDFIIMDQQMPELDGIQATQAIRALNIQTPVLLLSADVFEDSEKITTGLFQQTMTKPFERSRLIQTMATLLASYPPAIPNATTSPTSSNNPVLPLPNDSGVTAAQQATTLDDELSLEYRQSLPEQAAQLRTLSAQADWPAVKLLLHKIKGTSACFGLNQISQQADKANRQLQQNLTLSNELLLLIELLAEAGDH